MRFDQPLESGPRAVERARIAEQPPVVMRGEHDPKQIEGELPGIGIGFQVALIDGKADRLGNRAAKLALAGDLQPSPLQLCGRLGDVEGHAYGEDPFLGQRLYLQNTNVRTIMSRCAKGNRPGP